MKIFFFAISGNDCFVRSLPLPFFEYFMFYVLFWKRKMYSVLYGLCPIYCLGFFLEYFMYYVLCTFLCTCWLHTPYVYNYIFLGEKIYLPLNVTFQNEEGIDGGLGSTRFLYISIGHLLDTWFFRSIKWISRSWWRYLDLLGGGLATQVDSPTHGHTILFSLPLRACVARSRNPSRCIWINSILTKFSVR